jgi:aspartyl-tRNA synthetase
MELQDLSPALVGTDFAPYAAALGAGGEVKGIVVQGGAGLSRKVLDDLQEFAKRYGASGLAWIKLGDDTTSSLLKALGEAGVAHLASTAGAAKGDAVLIVAGKAKTVAASLGPSREVDTTKRFRAVMGNRVSDV